MAKLIRVSQENSEEKFINAGRVISVELRYAHPNWYLHFDVGDEKPIRSESFSSREKVLERLDEFA